MQISRFLILSQTARAFNESVPGPVPRPMAKEAADLLFPFSILYFLPPSRFTSLMRNSSKLATYSLLLTEYPLICAKHQNRIFYRLSLFKSAPACHNDPAGSKTGTENLLALAVSRQRSAVSLKPGIETGWFWLRAER